MHYNVSSEVGLISLDFIPEVLGVACTAAAVTVRLSDIAAAREWRRGYREKEIGGSGGSTEPPGRLLLHQVEAPCSLYGVF